MNVMDVMVGGRLLTLEQKVLSVAEEGARDKYLVETLAVVVVVAA
jgi:hypothetical protein